MRRGARAKGIGSLISFCGRGAKRSSPPTACCCTHSCTQKEKEKKMYRVSRVSPIVRPSRRTKSTTRKDVCRAKARRRARKEGMDWSMCIASLTRSLAQEAIRNVDEHLETLLLFVKEEKCCFPLSLSSVCNQPGVCAQQAVTTKKPKGGGEEIIIIVQQSSSSKKKGVKRH